MRLRGRLPGLVWLALILVFPPVTLLARHGAVGNAALGAML